MKRIILLMTFLLILQNIKLVTVVAQEYQGWFWQYPKPQGNTLRDIFIFDKNTAIAVGDLGTVIKTSDGGENWDVQHHAGGTSYNLYSVYFTDNLHGWAAGGIWFENKNTLLKTSDGGKTWTKVETQTDLPLNAVYFVNEDTGFVVGEDGIVLRTTDGGNNWDTRKIDDYIGYYLDVFRLLSITFTDDSTGWIVGAGYYGNQIYKTTDCGKTWQWNEWIVYPKIYSGLLDVCFIDKNNGFIIGDMGTFLKTTDGGDTWQYQNLWEKYQKEDYEYFYSVFFVDSLTGWIVGGDYNNGYILKTSDGGDNWIEEPYEIKVSLFKIFFANKTIGWTVGADGLVFLTNDGGQSWIPQRDEKCIFNSIYFIDENTGWAVGKTDLFEVESYEKGIILHTEDGGNTWQKQYEADSISFSSVYAIDKQNVFGVGAIITGGNWPSYKWNGAILRTINGGKLWVSHTFDTLGTFNSIAFLDDSVGWVTATNGTLLKTIDRGNIWQQSSSNLGTILDKIQFVNASIGWVSYYRGNKLLKTVDGGQTWNQQLVDSSLSMYSFQFINPNQGWAVGNYGRGKGRILNTADGGENWTLCGSPPKTYYYSVFFLNEMTGWVAGNAIIKSTDGGNTWIRQPSPSTISDIYFLNDNIGWAAGNGIFKTINGGDVVSVKDAKKLKNRLPEQIELFQNYPNPFNLTTSIKYQLARRAQVKIDIFNIIGQEIEVLLEGIQDAGFHTVDWNPGNISSGIYFYRLTTETSTITKKMLFLR